MKKPKTKDTTDVPKARLFFFFLPENSFQKYYNTFRKPEQGKISLKGEEKKL